MLQPGKRLTWRVLIALVLGLALGIVVASYPRPSLLAIVAGIEPVGLLWVNAIRMTVVPLVVSLLVTAVASSADARGVGTVSGRALATFLGLLLVAAVFGLTVVPLLFTWLHVPAGATATLGSASAATTPAAPSFAEWLVGIIPVNPIKAAVDGAMLPLVVFTIAFGLAVLRIPDDRRHAVLTLFRAIGDAMLSIVRVLIALAPIGVFALMLPVASRVGAAAAGALGYYVVAMAAACIGMIVVLYAVVWAIGGVSLSRFARAVFPAQAVAISTTSSLASLPALIDGAERRLELPTSTTGVVLPLAVSIFKIGSPVVWMVAVIFLSHFYGVPLAYTQLLVVSATALLTSFSVPGVPHGWLLVISPLLATMHIPPQAIGILIAVDSIPDIVATTLNVTADMTAVTIVARRDRQGAST